MLEMHRIKQSVWLRWQSVQLYKSFINKLPAVQKIRLCLAIDAPFYFPYNCMQVQTVYYIELHTVYSLH